MVRPTGPLDPIIEVRPVATQVDDLLSEIRLRTAINERVPRHHSHQADGGGLNRVP